MNQIDEAKLAAVHGYIHEREKCLNPDMTPYKLSDAAIVAFLNGWDAAMQHLQHISKAI